MPNQKCLLYGRIRKWEWSQWVCCQWRQSADQTEFDQVLNLITRCAQMTGLLTRRSGKDGRRVPPKKRFTGENLQVQRQLFGGLTGNKSQLAE